MLVSVHLPKTARASFLNILKKYFEDAILADYEDIPVNTDPELRNIKALEDAIKSTEMDLTNIKFIHGHFLPLKYLPLKHSIQVKYVTL